MSILSTYKIPQPRGYAEEFYYIEDRSATSPNYFNVEFFPLVMGGGRHIIKLKGNRVNMRMLKTIDLEILDEQGNNVFCEVTNYRDRFNNYYIYIDIYDITAQGIATAYFVGEAKNDLQGRPVPLEQQNRHNVRWIKQFNIVPFERNNADLIFDTPPKVSVAQIIGPAKLKASQTTSSYVYTTITSSVDQLTIKTSEFQGYDRDFASSPDILDTRLKEIQINPFGGSVTENTVPTTVREVDRDIESGRKLNHTTRFSTIITATSSFFTKDHLGGYFEFVNSQSIPRQLTPPLPQYTAYYPSGSTKYSLLKSYNSTIVEVVNDAQVIINKPLIVSVTDTRDTSKANSRPYTFRDARQFSGSITYIPSDQTYITSSTVSQSYVQFTFSDLNPISGQVYRIKTSTKLGAITGDYKLLNDQIIKPVEYLTDAAFSNGSNYSRHESDYRLIGHFVTQSVLNDYWSMSLETPNGYDFTYFKVSSSIQIDSVTVPAQLTQSGVITTQYYQNYNDNQTYTLSFYLTLDPYTELEVYMNSDPINAFVITPQVYPRAFIKTRNKEKSRYTGESNRFGKYLGKIKNDRPTKKYYGKIVFDFQTDSPGFGRPVLRSRVIDEMNRSGNAYIGEISVKPYLLNGFTPNLVQYAVPLPQELITAATLTQSIDFRVDYFDYTGKQSEYTTYLDDVILNLQVEANSNTCQDDKLYYYYNNSYGANMTQKPYETVYS